MVRQMLGELQDHRHLIYTPAYAPDANRIEWLWRWSRREVTPSHQRQTVAALPKDIVVHFQTLAQHPEVAEVAVVGIPHPEFGEQVHAVVVSRDGVVTEALAPSLEAWCRDRLAGPKRPRSWEFAAELPRSEAGKLLRRLLKERYLR